MSSVISCRQCVLAAAMLGVTAARGEFVPEGLSSFFSQQGWAYETNTLEQAALSGILQTFEPDALVLPAGETAAVCASDATVELWPEGLAYWKAAELGGDKVRASLSQFLSVNAGRDGLILDLRGAGGNDYDMVDETAGFFRGGGANLYSLKLLRGGMSELHATVADRHATNMPLLVVLADGKTRDAAATLFAVLGGADGVVRMGQSTQGAAVRRQWVMLPGGWQVYMQEAEVVLPDGRTLRSAGVAPDVYVAATVPDNVSTNAESRRIHSRKSAQDRELMERTAGDATLTRAVDVLLAMKALGRRFEWGGVASCALSTDQKSSR